MNAISPPWNVVDLIMVAVLALSMAVGAWRGLVLEIMSLLGWFVAYFAARWYAADAAPFLPVGAPDSSIRLAVALAATFLAALVAWGLLSRLLRLLIHATPLSVVDRLLGAVFGAVRGLVILLAVVTAVSYTPGRDATAWRQSRGVDAVGVLLSGLKPVLPQQIGDRLRR